MMCVVDARDFVHLFVFLLFFFARLRARRYAMLAGRQIGQCGARNASNDFCARGCAGLFVRLARVVELNNVEIGHKMGKMG